MSEAKPYRIEVEVPGLPPMTNHKSRQSTHWRVKKQEVDAWKSKFGWYLKKHQRPAAPLKKAKVTLVRGSAVAPDPDGLVSGFKSTVDTMVKLGYLENDRFSNIGMPDYRWEKAPVRQGFVRVVIEEVLER